MQHPTIQQIKDEFKRLGYKWLPFQGIAIRSRKNDPNKFDDLIGFIDGDSVVLFDGTTNAGTKPLLNPSRADGVALVCPGQYIDAWTMGLHKGKYDAWKQVKPVNYWRDNDKDIIHEKGGKVYSGVQGFNWHRANELVKSTNVENWSEGCMVVADPKDFFTFLKASSETGLEFYTGTILDEWL